MPYIAPEQRRRLDVVADQVPDGLTAGELNYLVTTIVDGQRPNGTLSYNYVNMIAGVFECAKLELYRRLAAPYEDRKRELNGDVYGPEA